MQISVSTFSYTVDLAGILLHNIIHSCVGYCCVCWVWCVKFRYLYNLAYSEDVLQYYPTKSLVMCFSLLHWFIFVILVQTLIGWRCSNIIHISGTSGCLYKTLLSPLNWVGPVWKQSCFRCHVYEMQCTLLLIKVLLLKLMFIKSRLFAFFFL